MRGDNRCVLLARAAMLDRALQRAKRLRPDAVFTTVPEEERGIGHSGYWHRAPVSDAYTLRQWRTVLKLLVGDMAGSTRHPAIRAETRVEEQLAPERAGARIV